MTTRRRTVTGRQGLLLCVAMLLAGCAGTQAIAVRDPALHLRERVAQYWDARVKDDLLTTYILHEPAFRRAVSLTGFLQGRQGTIKVHEYELLGDERIEGTLGIVKVKVKSTVVHPRMIKPEPQWQEFEEQWVRVDGEWYRKFRFPVGDPYPAVDWDDLVSGKSSSAPLPAR